MKKNIIVILIIIAVISGFFFFISKDKVDDNVAIVSEGVTVGMDFVSVLNTLQSLRFDMSVFEDPIFLGLIDWSVNVESEPIGRPNPFTLLD